MQSLQTWIWQQADWPHSVWDQAAITPALAQARLAQGKVLGAARQLDSSLTMEAVAAILVEDGLTTSAIKDERIDLDAVHSSVARHLGLPSAGLTERINMLEDDSLKATSSAAKRAIDKQIDKLQEKAGRTAPVRRKTVPLRQPAHHVGSG